MQLAAAAEQLSMNLPRECFDTVKRVCPNLAEVRKMSSAQIREKCNEQVNDFNKFDQSVFFNAIKQVKQGKRMWTQVRHLFSNVSIVFCSANVKELVVSICLFFDSLRSIVVPQYNFELFQTKCTVRR